MGLLQTWTAMIGFLLSVPFDTRIDDSSRRPDQSSTTLDEGQAEMMFSRKIFARPI